MKIGFFGCGAIGSAIGEVHEELGQEVVRHDIRLNTNVGILLDCPVVLVCLPTPQAVDGSCDLTIIENGLDQLSAFGYRGTVVIKSTVPPGTGARLSKKYAYEYVSCPEFLREHNAKEDYLRQKLHIFGSSSETLPEGVLSLMRPLSERILVLPYTEAELVKYFHNTYNAWRITFANAFCDLSEKMGADYELVLSSVCKINNMSAAYLKSSREFKGFGGPCLPKDTAALAHIATILGMRSNVWQLCIDENSKWETTLPPGLRATGFNQIELARDVN